MDKNYFIFWDNISLNANVSFNFFYFYASEWLTLSKIIQSSFILLETVLLDLYDSFIGNIILQDIKIKPFSPIVYLQTYYDSVPPFPTPLSLMVFSWLDSILLTASSGIRTVLSWSLKFSPTHLKTPKSSLIQYSSSPSRVFICGSNTWRVWLDISAPASSILNTSHREVRQGWRRPEKT